MGGGISCMSCCGKLVKGAELGYEVVSVALPWLNLPNGKAPKSNGLLVVQVIRDEKSLPTAPTIHIQNGESIVQLHNVAGPKQSLPKNLDEAHLKKLNQEAPTAKHSMYIMMLVQNVDVDGMKLVVDFGEVPGTQPGPSAGVFSMSLNDDSVVISTNSSAAFGGGYNDVTAYHQQRVGRDGPKFALSVVRYNVLPNQRYPYNKPDLQALIEGTRDSDFNPYPLPINHITNGTQWINWGETLASRPDRIYSDGAIFPGEKLPRHPSPRTVEDCQQIIQYAIQNKLNVRVFGSNHSWAPLSSTAGVLVDNRQLNCIKPSPGFDPLNNGKEWPGYSMTINGEDKLADGKPTVSFPPGISTGDLERWIQHNGGYRMPTSTVEDVFTMGGILATGCHGTGKNNPNISDWVVAMEYVDWQGKLCKITRDSCPQEYLKKVQLRTGEEVELDHEDLFRAMLCNLGSFGIIWSYTMRIYAPAPVYLIAKTIPWKELFDDTDEARQNLADLQAKHETFECFYFPFRFTGKLFPVYEENPDLYVWLGDNKPPEGEVIYEPTDEEQFGADLTQHMGIFMLGKLFQNATAEPLLYAMMPYLASMMYLNLLLTVTPDNKPCAWKIPQWRESHPFNAIGSVEGVPCCDIEWTMDMNTKKGAAGYLHPNRAYGDLIRAIHAAHRSSSNPFDMARFPVTITAEMRIFHGSRALMCSQYTEHLEVDNTEDGTAWCAPEIVTHSGNAGWDHFYREMNEQMCDPKNADRYGTHVKCHQAKEFSVLPNQLAFMRNQFRAEKYKNSNPFDYFTVIRDVIDPNRIFVNPYLHQYLYTENPNYQPPKELPIFTRGQIQRLDPNFKAQKAE